jgi:hypothetical protein
MTQEDSEEMDSAWMATMNQASERAFRTRILIKNPGLKDQPEALTTKVEEEAAKKSQVCVADVPTRNSIVYLYVQHLHFHPITHLQATPYSADNYKYDVWKLHVKDMHRLCKELGESWAWEYLWENWCYVPIKVFQMLIL